MTESTLRQKQWFDSLSPERQKEVKRMRADSAKRSWAKLSPEEQKRRRKASRLRHLDKRIADTKAWRARNKEHVKAYNKQWNLDNPGRGVQLTRAWRAENKGRRNAGLRKRYREDPRYRVEINIRTRITTVLRRKLLLGHKSAASMQLVGCSVEKLMEHIESQFKPGMTWDNHGEWHIDHIRPCASFNLIDPEEQRKCFHYTNLQPLTAEENLKKQAKWQEQESEKAA